MPRARLSHYFTPHGAAWRLSLAQAANFKPWPSKRVPAIGIFLAHTADHGIYVEVAECHVEAAGKAAAAIFISNLDLQVKYFLTCS